MRAQRRRRLQARDADPQEPQPPLQTALEPDVVPEAAPSPPPVPAEEPVPSAGIPPSPAPAAATSSVSAAPVATTAPAAVSSTTFAPPTTVAATVQATLTKTTTPSIDVETVTMTVNPQSSVPAKSGGGLSEGAAVGIGLAIVFVLAAACALGFICFRRHRRRVRGRVDPYASASVGARAMPMEPLSSRRSILKRPGAGPGVYSSVNDYSRLPDDDDESLPQYHARAQPGEKAVPLSPTRDMAALDTTEILAEPSTSQPIPAIARPIWPFSSRSRSPSTDSTASTVTVRPFMLSVQPPTAPASANASAAVTPSLTPRASRSASPSPYETEEEPSRGDAKRDEAPGDNVTGQSPTSPSLLRSDTFGHSSSSGASTTDSVGSEDMAAVFQEVRRGQPAQATSVADIMSVSRAGTIHDNSLASFGSTGSSNTSKGKETTP